MPHAAERQSVNLVLRGQRLNFNKSSSALPTDHCNDFRFHDKNIKLKKNIVDNLILLANNLNIDMTLSSNDQKAKLILRIHSTIARASD